jgi:hypothetical protein
MFNCSTTFDYYKNKRIPFRLTSAEADLRYIEVIQHTSETTQKQLNTYPTVGQGQQAIERVNWMKIQWT